MSAPEVDSVVSPASFTQVLSPQAGDFVILLRDQSSNPKFRLIDVANVGGSVDFLDNGVLTSTRNALNLVGGGFVLTDDPINEWANLQVGTQLQENNVDLTLRSKLNFLDPNVGQGFIITDDAGNDRTDIQLFGTPFFVINTTGTSNFPFALGSNAMVAGTFSTGSGLAASVYGVNSDGGGDRCVVVGAVNEIASGGTEAVAVGYDNQMANTCTRSIQIGADWLINGASQTIQIGTGSGGSTTSEDKVIQIGHDLTGVGSSTGAIMIGDANLATFASIDAVIIGNVSGVINGAVGGVAIGPAAFVDGALRSVQFGTGTNSNTDTMQYQTVTFVNDVGIEVPGNVGDPNGSLTARQRTLVVDDNTGTDLYINTDGATAWSLISGSGGGGGGSSLGGKAFNTTIGDNASTNIAVSHNLGTRDVAVVIYRNSAPYDQVVVDTEHTDDDTVTFDFTVAPTLNEFAVFIYTNPDGYIQTVGDNASTSIAVSHNLGTRDVLVSVYRNSAPYDEIVVDTEHTDDNTITLNFTVAPTLNEFAVFIATVTAGGGGAPAYTNGSLSSGVDVTITPGVSDNRVFISPTVASINAIVLTAGATNTTFFTLVNDDPATGSIDVKIDLVGNPTQVTLDNAAPVINVAFDGTDYKFYS